ncbi:C40 family peptidase [Calidifontibacter terrae]
MAGDQAVQGFVTVDSTVLWRRPDSPRSVDAAMLSDEPDHAAWLAAMDEHDVDDALGRTGLLDRIETELNRGEAVEIHATDGDWTQVTASWQPHQSNERGYPGWVRTAHLQVGPTSVPRPVAGPLAVTAETFLAKAREHLGLGYLWGGNTAAGLDCSGLVHYTARALGYLVPRDGADQQEAGTAVPLDDVRPGDLYFFAHPGNEPHHVGIVIEKGLMLHAPESGAAVVEEPLGERRTATLCGAARILV